MAGPRGAAQVLSAGQPRPSTAAATFTYLFIGYHFRLSFLCSLPALFLSRGSHCVISRGLHPAWSASRADCRLVCQDDPPPDKTIRWILSKCFQIAGMASSAAHTSAPARVMTAFSKDVFAAFWVRLHRFGSSFAHLFN